MKLLFFIILSFISQKSAQNNSCVTSKNENGICIILTECQSLFKLYYETVRTREIINYMLQSQAICGSRSLNRQPIICCPQTIETITKCIGPDLQEGICKHINSCNSIKSELDANPRDETILSYISASNVACNYISENVCCPADDNKKKLPKLLTPDEGCGFSNTSHMKIVGGQPAEPGAWPWMVLLGYTDKFGDIEWKCGGSLITSKHILTAAHCTTKTLTTARLGEHDLSSPSESNPVDIPIVKIEKYPEYARTDGHSDLAILYLKNEVEFTSTIKPICLPIEEPLQTTNFVGYQPFIAGWGRTVEGGTESSVLQEAQIPILENSDCKDRYQENGKMFSARQFDEKMLCAGMLSGGKDTCQGDSGGPLMIAPLSNRKSIFYQIGIVAYSIGCARVNIPGVYTNVPKFINWIEQKINQPL